MWIRLRDCIVSVVFSAGVIIASLFFGAYLHEKDIQHACAKNGNTSGATWIHELKCSPVHQAIPKQK